jgi:uncharacterized protein (TIGR03435 family)
MEKLQSEMDLMLRALLEQRFQLKVHWETKDLPVYELTLAKAGKLRRGSSKRAEARWKYSSSITWRSRRQISHCRRSECLAVTAGWTHHTAKLASP